MADPEEEFDPFNVPDIGDGDEDETGDSGFDPFDVPDFEPTVDPEPRSAGEDALLGLIDGLLLNNAGELGNLGVKLGAALAPEPALPRASGRGLDAPLADDQGPDIDMEALYELARESPAGKAGHGAGLLTTGVLGSMAAGPGVGAQALAGGAMGGLSTGGDTGYDPLSTLIGAGGGGVLGAVGGAVGKGAQWLQNWLKAPSNAAALGTSTTVPSNAARMMESMPLDPAKGVQRGLLGPLAGRATLRGMDAASSVPGLYRGAGGAMASAAPQSVSGLFMSKGHAQDIGDPSLRVDIGEAQLNPSLRVDIGEAQIREPWNVEIGDAEIKAYAGMPTLSWSLQSVLSSGNSGLPPQAEQQLTEALFSGDDSKVIATNFRLQQKYPSYAKRLRDELASLNEE